MIRVTIEVREGVDTRPVRISAPSIERALKIAENGAPGCRVHLLFPIDPEVFFVPDDFGRRGEVA